MSDPFLILHKVRGEPAFDIAIKIKCPNCEAIMQGLDFGTVSAGCSECDGEGFWWIIPTSGHRAHPYGSWNIAELELNGYPTMTVVELCNVPMPDPWPDHYPSRTAPAIDISSVITALAKPSEPVERRF